MDLKLKYKSNIDWDYILRKSEFVKKKITNNNFKFKARDFDYAGNAEFKLNFKKKRDRINSNKKQSKSINGIYYGILFIFFFGFLFFLSISIGFASTKSNITEQVIYDENKSNELLKHFILNEINENNDENSEVNNKKIIKTKRIEYSKYRVKKYDNLEKIAAKFGLSVETIALVNNIFKGKNLRIGKLLTIPNQDGRIITVKANDSIFRLADMYGIKWERIVDVNNIETQIIIPGTKLFIPESRMNKYERELFYGIDFIWPVKGKITSPYGLRKDPFTGIIGFHTGLDIKGYLGERVKNTRDGKVVFIGWNKIYGNLIIIKHSNNYMTTYAHLSKIDVKLKQDVKQGEYIGRIGTTGRSTGPHLHFEVRKQGRLVNPLTCLE